MYQTTEKVEKMTPYTRDEAWAYAKELKDNAECDGFFTKYDCQSWMEDGKLVRGIVVTTFIVFEPDDVKREKENA